MSFFFGIFNRAVVESVEIFKFSYSEFLTASALKNHRVVMLLSFFVFFKANQQRPFAKAVRARG